MPADGDIYLIGGGEDGPQALAAQRLIADGGLHRAVERGAVVFSVCAGYQLMGSSFFAKGAKCAGLEMLGPFTPTVDRRGRSASWPARSTRSSACRRSPASRTTAAGPTSARA